MTERPILFSGLMVRAILAGRKTVTRRIVSGAPYGAGCAVYGPECIAGDGSASPACAMFFEGSTVESRGLGVVRCPYGSPGDRLWVRETWRYGDWTEDGLPWIDYAADDHRALCEHVTDDWTDRVHAAWAELSDPSNTAIDGRAADRRWRPSIFMPRWAARLVLDVVGIRIERLQEITEDDARAEGVNPSDAHIVIKDGNRQPDMERTHRGAFACLWDGINGDRASWESNPWVWRVEFRRVQPC